jgi:hypothetical protein
VTVTVRLFLAVLLTAAAVAVVGVSSATADPLRPPKASTFPITCTGLGLITVTNLGPAHTEAFQVVGSNTIILAPFNGAPGILARALAAGTSCDGVPVVIVNG